MKKLHVSDQLLLQVTNLEDIVRFEMFVECVHALCEHCAGKSRSIRQSVKRVTINPYYHDAKIGDNWQWCNASTLRLAFPEFSQRIEDSLKGTK